MQEKLLQEFRLNIPFLQFVPELMYFALSPSEFYFSSNLNTLRQNLE